MHGKKQKYLTKTSFLFHAPPQKGGRNDSAKKMAKSGLISSFLAIKKYGADLMIIYDWEGLKYYIKSVEHPHLTSIPAILALLAPTLHLSHHQALLLPQQLLPIHGQSVQPHGLQQIDLGHHHLEALLPIPAIVLFAWDVRIALFFGRLVDNIFRGDFIVGEALSLIVAMLITLPFNQANILFTNFMFHFEMGCFLQLFFLFQLHLPLNPLLRHRNTSCLVFQLLPCLLLPKGGRILLETEPEALRKDKKNRGSGGEGGGERVLGLGVGKVEGLWGDWTIVWEYGVVIHRSQFFLKIIILSDTAEGHLGKQW